MGAIKLAVCRAAESVRICVAGVVSTATPAFAASPQIEDYCWAKAAQI